MTSVKGYLYLLYFITFGSNEDVNILNAQQLAHMEI